jgi:hypothetical protein
MIWMTVTEWDCEGCGRRTVRRAYQPPRHMFCGRCLLLNELAIPAEQLVSLADFLTTPYRSG